MEQLIFDISNRREAELLIQIAERLGLKKYKILKNKERGAQIKSIIKKGVDVSNFGDPSEWQRQTRKDRKIIGI